MKAIGGERLTPRKHQILISIIQRYILTAEPVGSRHIAKHTKIGLSPATIRNEMSDLEDMGYLQQPHTSAGRIPTDMGYRLYVDQLMESEELTGSEKEEITSSVFHASDVEEVLEITSQALGKITKQLGVALSPKFQDGILKKIDLVSLFANKALMVLALKSGIVKTITIETSINFSPEQLRTVSSILNERLSGRRISEIQVDLGRFFSDIEERKLNTIRLFMPSVQNIFKTSFSKNVHTGGIPSILEQPEFINSQSLGVIMELLEDRDTLIHLLNKRENASGVLISIGGENNDGQFNSFSIVTSNYNIGQMKGTLGVIGPTRMPYPKLISAVDYTVKALEGKHQQ